MKMFGKELENFGKEEVYIKGERYVKCVYRLVGTTDNFCKHYGDWVQVYRAFCHYTDRKQDD